MENAETKVSKAPEGVDIKIWRREVKYKDKQSDFLIVILIYNTPILFIVTEDEIVAVNATNFAHNGRSKILYYRSVEDSTTELGFDILKCTTIQFFLLYSKADDKIFKNEAAEPYEKEPRAYKNKEIYQGILRKECVLIAPFLGKNIERRQEKAAAKKMMKHLQYIEKSKGMGVKA